MKIGVVGASGYSGGELLRLLAHHPHFEVSYLAAGSNAGVSVTAIHPQLLWLQDRVFEETSVSAINQLDLVFFALPHGESAKLIAQIQPQVKIVDLGADFRLSDPEQWGKYYGGVHAGAWQYGLPEIHGNRSKIQFNSKIANPGCYATSIILAAAPALSSGLIFGTDIVAVAASGTTGAGRSAKVNLLASEVMGSLTSYKFGGVHQHTPEIEETLSGIKGEEVRISFTPILAPMPRGILSTVTAPLKRSISEAEIRNVYREYFADEKFVTLLPEGQLPKTAALVGSNSISMQVALDAHTNRLIVSAALDNLGKGAAGQALQNANLMMGIEESLGLSENGTP
ncbi:MAG: N-acetyl-gamma-glutamyl-phosphate reductase [Actinomycetes bacterium]